MNTQRRPTSYVTLDLTLPDVQTSLAVTQGDTTRRIVATIQDGGRPFELPRKWTAMLTGTKPDGKFLYNSCVIDYSGRIVYDFAAGTEIATAIGDYAVIFEIYDEAGDKVSSPSLWLSVKPDKTRDHASHDQFTAAQEILGRLNKVEDGLDFLEGDQDSEYLAYEGASLIRVNKEAPNGYDALKVSSYTDYLHIVKFDSTLYEVATNELAGYWVEINGKRAYVGSNTVDSLTLYTDHTMTRPSAFLAYPDDLIHILGDDVTNAMLGVIGAVPTTRTINAKPLSADINLTAADVSAAPAGFGGYGEITELIKAETNAQLFSTLENELTKIPYGCGKRLTLSSREQPLRDFNYIGVLQHYEDGIAVFKGITYGETTSIGDREPIECVISKNGNNWIIELVNPPMHAGVEYRTTERWDGRPVWTVLINCGDYINGGYSIITNFTCLYVFDARGRAGYAMLPRFKNTFEKSGTIEVTNSNGYIAVDVKNSGDQGSGNCLVQVWYTKS